MTSTDPAPPPLAQHPRALSSDRARAMVSVREARKLFHLNRVRCFWWTRPDLVIGLDDVAWVADGLRKQGGRADWFAAAKLDALLKPKPH
jgi:hypothetical protein